MQGETMESRSNECHQSLHTQHQCPHISSGFNYRPSNELSESSGEKRFLMACKNGGGENIIRVKRIKIWLKGDGRKRDMGQENMCLPLVKLFGRKIQVIFPKE